MIRHIVTWRLAAADAEQRAADAAGIKQRLEGLRGVVTAERIDVGVDLGETDGNWHVVLDSDFATTADLAAYQTHPAHLEAAAFIRSVVEARSCVDYRL
ncbi:Dabb family protein [Protaetiibacter intestinalis]|uniref:Dabb family protein n=1 Tax=Protaetiibacter intestinalis TaxID=2419774 RepID=A0A387BAX6_9MICO|nr:Dabb family protein [Protaetiibacter intestinalis]AYF98089.1 Dabb family protein [Protaetiibacter intestinalis]